jgi:hypothetical protein
VLGPFATDPAAAAGVDLGPLGNIVPSSAERLWSRYTGPIAAPLVARSTPTWVTTPPRAPAAGHGLPIPVEYRSKASRRTTLPIGRHQCVRFEEKAVRLIWGQRIVTIPYGEIDDFRIALQPSNLWQLVVQRTDGRQEPLPGLHHGLWASSPLLVGNQLTWQAGGDDAKEAGSIPWGSDDDGVIAACLNAQLAFVRGDARLADAA